MRCLTLTQPWATLVALGAKRIETRSWSTSYRGPLAIHAAKGWTASDRELCREEPFLSALQTAYAITDPDGDDFAWLPFGVVVAIAYLDDVRLIVRPGQFCQHRVLCRDMDSSLDLDPATLTDQERAFGNYTPGRYAWMLTGVTPLAEPVPARGYQGLWSWDALGLALPEVMLRLGKLSPDARRALEYLLGQARWCAVTRVAVALSGSDAGSTRARWSKAAMELADAGFAERNHRGEYQAAVERGVRGALAAHGASGDEVAAVVAAVVGRLATGERHG